MTAGIAVIGAIMVGLIAIIIHTQLTIAVLLGAVLFVFFHLKRLTDNPEDSHGDTRTDSNTH